MVLFGKTLGDDLHARRARLRHEDAFIQAQRISALSRCLRVAQGVGDLDVIRRARGDQRGKTGHVPGQQAILEESPIDLIDRLRRLNAQAGGEQAGVNVAALVTFEPRRLREQLLLAQRLVDEGTKAADAGLGGELVQRRAERSDAVMDGARQRVEARGGEQLGSLLILDHLETRRDIRFEGKQMQQLFAEGVNGLDLQPARCFHRARKQPPGEGQAGGFDLRLASRKDCSAQLVVAEPRPFRQFAKHADRHVRGRRLGEGQAQDARGRHAIEQQADHALCQHMRLARSGIGGHPCRDARIGGAHLVIARGLGDRALAHSLPSPPAPADHSLTRARWS